MRIPRNWVPRTPAEAERLLWHAQGHLANNREVCCSEHMTNETKQAMETIYQAIANTQNEQGEDKNTLLARKQK